MIKKISLLYLFTPCIWAYSGAQINSITQPDPNVPRIQVSYFCLSYSGSCVITANGKSFPVIKYGTSGYTGSTTLDVDIGSYNVTLCAQTTSSGSHGTQYYTCGAQDSESVTVTGSLNSPNVNAPAQSKDGKFAVSWNPVSSANFYIWRYKFNNNWSSETVVNETHFNLNFVNNGAYTFEVKSCVSTNNCSAYASATTQVNLTGASQRRVVFIHTDILGTPIAESDENGASY